MEEIRFCKKHGNTPFFLDKSGTWRCKKCRNEAVQKRREKLKLMAIEYKGGKCEICGYDKCPDAMEFHHINSNEKDFGISQNGCTRSFDNMKKELDKCILVCSNCHREIHYNLRDKQTDNIKEEILNEKKQKLVNIPSKNVKREAPSKEEVISLMSETKSFSEAGRVKNVSDNAVRKWCRKYNIPTHTNEMLMYLHDIGRLP